MKLVCTISSLEVNLSIFDWLFSVEGNRSLKVREKKRWWWWWDRPAKSVRSWKSDGKRSKSKSWKIGEISSRTNHLSSYGALLDVESYSRLLCAVVSSIHRLTTSTFMSELCAVCWLLKFFRDIKKLLTRALILTMPLFLLARHFIPFSSSPSPRKTSIMLHQGNKAMNMSQLSMKLFNKNIFTRRSLVVLLLNFLKNVILMFRRTSNMSRNIYHVVIVVDFVDTALGESHNRTISCQMHAFLFGGEMKLWIPNFWSFLLRRSWTSWKYDEKTETIIWKTKILLWLKFKILGHLNWNCLTQNLGKHWTHNELHLNFYCLVFL